jgi:hypothetical protein
MRRLLALPSLVALVALVALVSLAPRAQELTLPNTADSVKFAAMGDNGSGDAP